MEAVQSPSEPRNEENHSGVVGDIISVTVLPMFSIGIVLLISWTGYSVIQKGVFVADILKLLSIAVLMFHTQFAVGRMGMSAISEVKFKQVRFWNYRNVSVYMAFMVILLTVYNVLLLVPEVPGAATISCGQSRVPVSAGAISNVVWSEFVTYCLRISPTVHSQVTAYIITALSVSYFPLFWVANVQFMNHNPNDAQVRRFARAFIFGVDIPFIVSYLSMQAISPFLALKEQPLFFAGGVAFSVYYSTAASLSIDWLLRPTLESEVARPERRRNLLSFAIMLGIGTAWLYERLRRR